MIHLLNLLAAIALLVWGTHIVRTGMLRVFGENLRAILSRSELEDRIYGWGEEVESNAVEYLIHALRRKLGSNAIKNVRGVGWMVSKGA